MTDKQFVEDEEIYDIPDLPDTNPILEDYIGTVTCKKFLNVRAKPSEDARIIATIRNGEIVEIDQNEQIEGWYKVRTEQGVFGFCMSEYIKVYYCRELKRCTR